MLGCSESRRHVGHLLVIVCCVFAVAVCRPAPKAEVSASEERDHWGPLRLLVGTWDGAIEGRLGTGTGVREYEFILEENFLMFRQASVRMPQELSPAGDHHRELSIFSYDEVFELAFPGEDLSVYFTNRWTRRPVLP